MMPAFIPSSTLEKFTTFGDLLRYLRRRVGLTQMELADTVGYSDAQISRLEQNLRPPDLSMIELHFVPALGLEDEPKTVARLLDLAADVRRENAPALGLCPYKGLNYYDENDADLFVGREDLTNKLVDRTLGLTVETWRFLAIVGASGSGKSSLVRAGLVAALRWNKKSMDWTIHILTPTAHPLESLADSLDQDVNGADVALLADDLADDFHCLQRFAGQKRVGRRGSYQLLVIDQFEELFTLCHNEDERAAFIANLLAAAADPDGPIFVLITLRADFYAHCAAYEQLREALARHQEYIGAMSAEEIRRTIEEPARRGRWEFEAGLVDLLLHEVGHEPGALPLLSHALLETWHRRRGHTLTLSGYTSSGGVRGAIAETAEAVFTDQFTHEQQAIARRIFLRLTELGDESGTGDTRRRATFNELILKPEEASVTLAVLKALADARLITTSEDAAEVAHEALIREWPTLHGWLEDNREALRLHRQLTEAANEWRAMDREPDMLFRGARLAQVSEWASAHEDEMNALEGEFLRASIEFSQREAEEREAQRQRELEAERQRAEEQAHSAARLRRRALYLVGALLVALVMAGAASAFANRSANLAVQNAESARFAGTQQAVAEAEADGRATQQAIAEKEAMARATQQAMAEGEAQARAAAEAIALQERDQAQAHRLAAEANSLRLNNGDPNLIALLTIRSLHMQYTPSGDAVLSSLNTLQAPPRELKGHTDFIHGVDISPDGKYLATGSVDQTARLWDLASGETVRTFSGQPNGVGGVVFSPDGKNLVTAGEGGTTRLWDIASGQTVQEFSGQPGGADYVAFSPDGRFIATTGFNPAARIWDVATGQTVHILTGHEDHLTRVAYSPDGKYVLTGSGDNTARLWDAATGDQVQVFPGHTHGVSSVAFSPDGKYVATGDDPLVRLWDPASGELVREFSGHQGLVSGIEFSPDGKTMATVSHDLTVRLWDPASGQLMRVLGRHGAAIQDVTFSPDGKLLVTAGDDMSVKVWSLQTFQGGMQFDGRGGPVWQARFSPDSKRVVIANDDGIVRIWDTATGQTVTSLTGHTSLVRDAVFSPDGKLVLTASEDGTARLWDAASGEELRRFEGHTDVVRMAVFSPDEKHIVTTSFDGTARVWDAQTAQEILTYTDQGPGHVNRIAFSPDGKAVVTSADDGTARIWDPLTGKDLMVFKGHTDAVTGVAFSPDGRYLLTASWDGSVRLWEVVTGNELRRFLGHTGYAYGTAFSPDGEIILSSGADGTARLWDVQTGEEVRRFTGHTNEVREVAFSPDGKYILTASNDGTARLWMTDLQDTIRAVCALLTRDLTPKERAQFGISDQEPTCPVP